MRMKEEMMSTTITPQDIVDDLKFAAEAGSEFGYALDEDEQAILVEQYGDDGEIAATYRMTMTFEVVA